MPHATFETPDLTTFCQLDELGLECTGQHLTPERAVLECRLADPDPWCRDCGGRALSRGTISRALAHGPFEQRPATVLLRVRRYQCPHCGRHWREDTTRVADPRAKLTRTGMLWALSALVIDHLTIARIAAGLGVAWHTANDAVLAEGHRLLISDPHRLDGVRVLGVDKHSWRHTRRGEKFVTVIIDLTPVRDGTGPARLLDMVEGRSKKVFKTWLETQEATFRNGIEQVAIDGFTGFKTAATEVVPTAVVVMDPFHVTQLFGHRMERCRQRVQQATLGRQGRAGDPLYRVLHLLHTGVDLLTERGDQKNTEVFADEAHAAVEVTWRYYQQAVAACRQRDRARGKRLLQEMLDELSHGIPKELPELASLGRTRKRRPTDLLAYFDRPGTSNGPTKTINGQLDSPARFAPSGGTPSLRGSALGFRNLTHYIARSLLEAGGSRTHLHA